jgi:hypothetical protein
MTVAILQDSSCLSLNESTEMQTCLVNEGTHFRCGSLFLSLAFLAFLLSSGDGRNALRAIEVLFWLYF